MIESPIYQEIIQEGKLIGLEEGELKARRTSVLDALSVRFELSYPRAEKLKEHLETISNLKQLQELFSEAVTTESLDNFEDFINKKVVGQL